MFKIKQKRYKMTQKITSLMALGFFLAGCVRPTADDATIYSQRTRSSNRVYNPDNPAMERHLKDPEAPHVHELGPAAVKEYSPKRRQTRDQLGDPLFHG